MTDTIARLRHDNKVFEIMVDLDSAMKIRKGESSDVNEAVRDTAIWSDLKKGMRAGDNDLKDAFGTTEFDKIVERIIKKGNLEVTQEYRDESLEQKKKQVVDFLVRNAVDAQTNRPFTPDMIESSIKQAGVKIENQPVDKQINRIMETLKSVLPIKIETKKIKIKIPAEHTGKVYGLIQDYKEKEDWLNDGSLEVILNIPVGIQSDFYDKLNNITHGSAITSEIKQE